MKNAITAALAAAALSVSPAVLHAQTETAQSVRPEGKAVWIDVREPEEYGQGHLRGAVNVPLSRMADEIGRLSPDKNAPVNLYCRTGRRAESALRLLKKMGYTNVTNHGGYEDLVKKGLQ